MNTVESRRKISVVVVTYNAGEKIKKTLESLIRQTYLNYEVLFIDGQSTDSTLNILKKYQKLFHEKNIYTFCLSEKDRGIYDAMNKGIVRANGDWIYFLNAGDVLGDENVFEDIFANIERDVDVIYGDTLDDYGYKIERLVSCQISDIRWKMPFCHQAVFAKTELLKNNLFDLSYSLCADYNQFLSLYLDGKEFEKIDRVVAIYARDGVSAQNGYLVLKQYKNIQICHGIYGYMQRREYCKKNIIGRLQTLKSKLFRKKKNKYLCRE